MSKTANINVRINPEIKRQAEEILDTLGMSASNAIDIFYRQIILNKGIPFEVKLPNYEIKSKEYDDIDLNVLNNELNDERINKRR